VKKKKKTNGDGIELTKLSATVQGGTIGGIAGLAAGTAGVYLASMRFPIINHLTLPMKAFLATSTGTFAGKRLRKTV
jgi:hypothetical protein